MQVQSQVTREQENRHRHTHFLKRLCKQFSFKRWNTTNCQLKFHPFPQQVNMLPPSWGFSIVMCIMLITKNYLTVRKHYIPHDNGVGQRFTNGTHFLK